MINNDISLNLKIKIIIINIIIMIKNIYMNIINYYNVYIKNIVNYYFPIIKKLSYNRKYNKFSKYNFFIICNKEYLYKIHNIDYNKYNYRNFGYTYHTTITDKYKISEIHQLDRFDPNYDIDSIQVYIIDKYFQEQLILLIDDNYQYRFISDVLNYSTNESKFDVLLYYYLQKYLKIDNLISQVYFKINNKLIPINFNNTLSNIQDIINKL
jgi:hypothetical protein